MASDSEWFQGRGVDEHEVAYWGRVLTELACAVCAGLILAGLSGCASTEDSRVCYMKLLGQTEQGYSVVVQTCMTPEAFTESQK